MMDNPEKISPSVLISQYVDGVLSDSGAKQLLEYVQKNPELLKFLKRNIVADLWLEGKFRSKRRIDREIPSTQNADFLSDIDTYREDKPLILPVTYNNADDHTWWRRLFEIEWDIDSRWAQKSLPFRILTHPVTKIVGVVCSVLLITLTLCFWRSWQMNIQSQPMDDEFQTIARVEEVIDVVSGDDTEPIRRGQRLGAGRLQLKEGTVKLRFVNGAELILDGLVDLSIRSELSVFCNQGRVSTYVPQTASGFELATPFATIVDHGTRFFTDVQEKEVEVMTLEGSVDFRTPSSVRRLTKGMGNLFDGISIKPPRTNMVKHYIDENKFVQLLDSFVIRQQEEKKKENLLLDQNPNLLVRFDALDRQGNTIPNKSQFGQNLASALTIIECGHTEGRIHGSDAIKFTDSKAQVRFDLSGEYETLSISATMKFDSMSEQGTAIFMSESFQREPGTFFWQIKRNGEVTLFLTTEEGKWETFTSPAVFSQRNCGAWLTLRIVLNGRQKTISQYLDGKLFARDRWENPIPLKVGRGILGNALNIKFNSQNRFFNGAIDEFHMTGTAVRKW